MSDLRKQLDALKTSVNRMRGGSFLNKALTADDAMDKMLDVLQAISLRIEQIEALVAERLESRRGE